MGFHWLRKAFGPASNPLFVTIRFLLLGVLAGGVSLMLFPKSFIVDHTLRVANIVITPLAIGGLMMLVGKSRAKRGQQLVGLDHFAYAFAFAFAMSVMRLGFAK